MEDPKVGEIWVHPDSTFVRVHAVKGSFIGYFYGISLTDRKEFISLNLATRHQWEAFEKWDTSHITQLS